MRNYNANSKVEQIFLKKNKKSKNINSKNEKVFTLQLLSFDELGKVTALRFLEWLQLNPKGVIALPTGNTPNPFIEHTINFLNNWEIPEVQKELKEWGLDSNNKPDMKSFYFVQLDEFFPINPGAENSFAFFINKYYINGFGLDKSKCLLMDICYKNASLQEARNFAKSYEEKIKNLGGIGFFLGGIGPDGHIAFNISGSDHESRTRILKINYQTAAAAATSFGGIENIRDKKVITIGLQTITQNETTRAIIIASGQGKAKVVKDAIENKPSTLYPATALQKLKGARFYITNDAAILLERNKKKLNVKINTIDLKKKIKTDLSGFNNKIILHTSPHHDDIALGYFPFIQQLVNETNCKNYFAIATGGYHAITDSFLKKETGLGISSFSKDQIKKLKNKLREKEEEQMWSHLGIAKKKVIHLGLPFYETGEINFNNDVIPVVELLKKINPDFITVCMDPEGLGPKTHFKVLQIMQLAVKEYLRNVGNKDLKIIGYRNVWSQFDLNEANLFIPVNQNELDNLKLFFKESYKSQVKASFPSIEYDESFDEISCKIMKDQYKKLEKYLGSNFFKNSEDQKLKNAKAFCFLRIFMLADFVV
ncbi:MAG: PIG-L family deacetylase [bacterium]